MSQWGNVTFYLRVVIPKADRDKQGTGINREPGSVEKSVSLMGSSPAAGDASPVKCSGYVG